MNIKSVIESDDKIDESFDDLQSDMAAALEEGLLSDDPAPVKTELAPEENIAAEIDGLPPQNELVTVEAPLEFEAATDAPEPAQKLTPHTQSRLAALNSFDKLYRDAQEHLQRDRGQADRSHDLASSDAPVLQHPSRPTFIAPTSWS